MIRIDVPHALCQECRQCCHFVAPPFLAPYASRSTEMPPTLPGAFLSRSGLPVLSPAVKDTIPVWTCSILDPDAFVCRDWPDHPLDCQIYPLVFFSESGVPKIGLDPSCPYSNHQPLAWFEEKARQIRETIWSKWTVEQKRTLLPFFSTDSFPGLIPLLSLSDVP